MVGFLKKTEQEDYDDYPTDFNPFRIVEKYINPFLTFLQSFALSMENGSQGTNEMFFAREGDEVEV